MDAHTPPAPPAVVHPRADRPFAHGEQPRWSLSQTGRAVVLRVAGKPDVALTSDGWTDTPRGRQLRLIGADASVATLVVAHAACTTVPGASPGALPATLTIAGARLDGCFDNDAERPYPGA